MVELTLEGPRKNALSTEHMHRVVDRLRQAGGAPVLLTGAGGAFSAGLDLEEVHWLDASGMERLLRALEEMVSTLFTYPGPTAAAVNGHAIAGGCLLALACDYRVAAGDAHIRIGLNEVSLGLEFPPGLLRMVRAVLPPERCAEVLLGSGLHCPHEAVRLGLVDATASEPLAPAREWLTRAARHPPDAYAAAKRALRGTSTTRPEDGPALQAILPSWTSPALKERIAALLRK